MQHRWCDASQVVWCITGGVMQPLCICDTAPVLWYNTYVSVIQLVLWYNTCVSVIQLLCCDATLVYRRYSSCVVMQHRHCVSMIQHMPSCLLISDWLRDSHAMLRVMLFVPERNRMVKGQLLYISSYNRPLWLINNGTVHLAVIKHS